MKAHISHQNNSANGLFALSMEYLFEWVLGKPHALHHVNPEHQKAKAKFDQDHSALLTTKTGTRRYQGLELWQIINAVHLKALNQREETVGRKDWFDYFDTQCTCLIILNHYLNASPTLYAELIDLEGLCRNNSVGM